MVLNLMLSAGVLSAMGLGGYKYYQSLSDSGTEEFDSDDYTDINTLKVKVIKEFSRRLRENFREQNLTKSELEQKQKKKASLRRNLKEAAYGNIKAKRNVKLMIKGMLVNHDLNMGISEETIDDVIPFKKPEELKNQDKFEIVMYIAYNLMNDELGRPLKGNGFAQIVKDFRLLDPVKVNGEMMYDFTEERLDTIYKILIEKYALTYNDKLEIISQRIFELYKGFGAVDTLFDTGIDEIDGGLSGIAKDGYELTNTSRSLTYTYQSIWIMISGVKMRLSCISFGSQEELVRVVKNIYKFGANKVLSKKTGYVISSMKNGNRCVVMRPPFANTYALLARKQDSAPSVDPAKLIKGTNAIIPLTIIKWEIIGERNLIISGDQGTGKTTWLKAIIRYLKPYYSIRVQEKSAELNLNFAYPYRNILSFQETESISMQEGLDMQKKTSGDVNVIGEIAEAIQTSFAVQVAMVASKVLLATHHGKTTDDVILSNANSLLDPTFGIYREKKEAIEIISKVFHNDMHLAAEKDVRYIERYTEVIPVLGSAYPSEVSSDKTHIDDELEYWKRNTDRKPYELRQIFHFEDGEYVLDNLPSEAAQNAIKAKLTEDEKVQFEKDMEMIKNLPRNPLPGGIRALSSQKQVLDSTQSMIDEFDKLSLENGIA